MTGLRYAPEVPSSQAAANGSPFAPPGSVQGMPSAGQALSALTSWPRAHASGSTGACVQTRGPLDGHMLGH